MSAVKKKYEVKKGELARKEEMMRRGWRSDGMRG
jgi:hypothetical protein